MRVQPHVMACVSTWARGSAPSRMSDACQVNRIDLRVYVNPMSWHVSARVRVGRPLPACRMPASDWILLGLYVNPM
jgi:hypothetical protein